MAAAAAKNYDTCGDKVIMVNDDNKVLMPPAVDTTAKVANRKDKEEILGAFVFAVFTLMFLIAVIYYRVDRDTKGLPKFQIQSVLTAPILNTSSSPSTVDFNFTFSITNGFDDTTILYNFNSVSLFYNRLLVSSSTLVPLFQGPEEQSTVEASFAVGPKHESFINAIVEDRRRRGVVELGIEVEVTVTLRPDQMSGEPRTKRLVWVTCKEVKVVFSSNFSYFGTLLEGPADCYSAFFS